MTPKDLIKKNCLSNIVVGKDQKVVYAEIVMTGFISDWSAFFRLRCDNHAHPDIRQLAIELRNEFYKKGYLV